jgi:hypothetical protein
MSLCGKCVSSDVPGNLMFAYMANRVGIWDWFRDFGAAVIERVDGDEEIIDEDRDVYQLGKQLAQSGSTDVCRIFERLPSRKILDGCKPCSSKHSFGKDSPFDRPDFPSYPNYPINNPFPVYVP